MIRKRTTTSDEEMGMDPESVGEETHGGGRKSAPGEDVGDVRVSRR